MPLGSVLSHNRVSEARHSVWWQEKISRYLCRKINRGITMDNTNKTAPGSAQELLEQSLAKYKDAHVISDEMIQFGSLNRQETIVVDLYLRLMKELEK